MPSASQPLASQLLLYVRQHLKRIPGVVVLWRLGKKALQRGQYCLWRFIGNFGYPILGRRVPLRGYYDKTRGFLQQGYGRCISITAESSATTDESRECEAIEPDTFVAVIPEGRSLYDYGVIISPDHKLLADVSWEGFELISQPLSHPAMYDLVLPPIQHIAGKVAVMTSLLPNNYYHWLFDILPRFEILCKSGLVPDYYLINEKTHFQKESLQVIGIPPHRIMSPTTSTHIEADELIVPSLLGPVFRGSPQSRACNYLRSIFLRKENPIKPYRSLYVTRADASSRRVINEEEMREEVLSHGFEVLSLSDVPFLQQIEIFSEARVIVGPHGAGFANAVFCQPGTVLIEFLPENYNVDCFEVLARAVGIKYHSIKGIEKDMKNNRISNHDHSVDRVELRKLLQEIV